MQSRGGSVGRPRLLTAQMLPLQTDMACSSIHLCPCQQNTVPGGHTLASTSVPTGM